MDSGEGGLNEEMFRSMGKLSNEKLLLNSVFKRGHPNMFKREFLKYIFVLKDLHQFCNEQNTKG